MYELLKRRGACGAFLYLVGPLLTIVEIEIKTAISVKNLSDCEQETL
jgi:hypothetical protein